MKWLGTIALASVILGSAYGQAPQGINYQGVARDSEGKPVASRDIAIRVTILNNGPSGETEYSEVHEVMTNQFGLFTIVIGQGQSAVSSFNFIGWANGSKWLQIEMDINGGRSFQLMGSQQLMSVPYALYAQYAGNSFEAGQGIEISNNRITNTGDSDNNPSNELNTAVTLGADHKLRISDAGGTKEADLSPLLGASQNLSNVLSIGNSAGNQPITNLGTPTSDSDAATKAYVDAHTDGDSDPANEIQDLTLNGNTLKVTNNTNASSIDLLPYLDNTDNQDLTLNLTTSSLQLSGDGTPVSLAPYLDNTDNQDLTLSADVLALTGDATPVDLSVYRQSLTKTGNNLGITGTAGTVDLSPYLDNTDAQGISLNPGTNILSISGNASTVDFSPYKQTLNNAGNTLNISGATSPIDLTPYLDNTDAQAISLNPGTNILSISGNASTVDFSPYKQTLTTGSVNPDTRSLSLSNGNSVNVDVRDADASVTNEIQDLSLNGATNILSLTNDLTPVDLSAYQQDLNLIGNTLSLSGDGTPVDLSPYVNTDNQNLGLDLGTNVLSISGGTGVNLGSYKQDLSLSGNTLSLSGDVSTVDLSGYVNTDNQTLSYNGASKLLSISGGNNVTITETQNISQVLANGNNTGGATVTGLPTPTNNTDAANKQYVDDADQNLLSRVSTTYAFKTGFSHTNLSSGEQDDQVLAFGTVEFDGFGVLGSNVFTAQESGIYVFIVEGNAVVNVGSTILLSLFFNGSKNYIPIPQPLSGNPRFSASIMFNMVTGQTVSLVGDNIQVGNSFTGKFSGFKL
ncbi:MAG: hypothetical protein AB7K37_05925 [Cyclobacteriaceae bacterium]